MTVHLKLNLFVKVWKEINQIFTMYYMYVCFKHEEGMLQIALILQILSRTNEMKMYDIHKSSHKFAGAIESYDH